MTFTTNRFDSHFRKFSSGFMYKQQIFNHQVEFCRMDAVLVIMEVMAEQGAYLLHARLGSVSVPLPHSCIECMADDAYGRGNHAPHIVVGINLNLEAMAKQLYDYWFVQFDFPNEEGKPYKSSGGEMLWNEKLKRKIPVGWHCGNLFEIAVFTNGLACQKFRPKDNEVPLPVIKIREMHDGISVDTEKVTSNIPESVKVYNGDVLFSWSASLEVMLWAYGLGGLNQHIFKVTSANDFPKSFYYFQLLDYVDVFKKWQKQGKQRWDILRKTIYNKAQSPYLIIKILRINSRN